MTHPKGLIPIVIVIFIAIIAAGVVGAAWYFQENRTDTNTVAAINTTNAVSNVNTTTTSNTNSIVTTNVNTSTTNTNTVVEGDADCPTWPTYTDPEYSWTMQYPCDWMYDRTYNAAGNDPFVTYPERYVKFIDPTGEYRLIVGIMEVGGTGSTINRTGVGAGDWADQAG